MWDFGFYFATFAPCLRPHPLLWSPVWRFPLSIYHFSPPLPQFLLSFYLHTSLFQPLHPFISCPVHFHCLAASPPPLLLVSRQQSWSVLTLACFSSIDVQNACSFFSFPLNLLDICWLNPFYFLLARRKAKHLIFRISKRININSSLQEAFPCLTGASLGGLMPIRQVFPRLSAPYFFPLNCMYNICITLALLQLVLLNIQHQSSILSHQMS